MPACPHARGGEHPAGYQRTGQLTLRCQPACCVQALLPVTIVGVAAWGWDRAQRCLPCCLWWVETHRWHPHPHRWTKPTRAAAFYCHRGFCRREGATAAPVRYFPAPEPRGHIASQRALTPPTLVHRAGKMSLSPTAWEGGRAPKGAQALWGVPCDGFLPRKESAPVLPTETLALVPSSCPGSSGHDPMPCGPAGKGDAACAGPRSRSHVILRHQAVKIRAGAVVARSQV